MTEYDYSPEGYERYMATQTRVSNWVNDQASQARRYSSPFGQVPRSTSSPPLDYDYRPSSGYRDGSGHRSSSRSSSSSRHHEPRPAYQHPDAYGPPRSGYPAPVAYSPHGIPPNSSYVAYNYDSTAREVVLPPPRKGETYVIIPPKGRRIEVITDGQSNVHSSSSSRSSSRSPTKSQPLLKRLFSNMGPPPRHSDHTSSRSGRSHRTRSY